MRTVSAPGVDMALGLFQQAVEAAKTGDRGVARDLFEQVTRARPGIMQAWLWRAHLAEGPVERVEYLSRARELDPENPKTLSDLVKALVEAGIARAKQSAKGEARRYLNEAIRLEPSLEAAWLWLASLADTSAERLRCVDRVLAINPAQPNALAWKREVLGSGGVPQRAPSAMTVLVVDDSMTVRSLVSRTLSRRGCKVVTAVDGGETLACLRDETPDLIFLDIDLPDVNGFELCRRIKAGEATAGVPVVMLSGKDADDDKLRGRRVGAEAHISKPFRPGDLVEAVRRFGP